MREKYRNNKDGMRHKSAFLKYVFRGVFCLVLLLQLAELLLGYRMFLSGAMSYESMSLGDWLINYEGGFVRRGLMGQMLLGLYRLVPHPVAYTIAGIYIVSLVVLLCIIYHVFRKNGWSLFIAVFPVCIFVSFLGVRRDYLMCVMCYLVFMQFARYLYTSHKIHLLWANAISMVAIFMHEVFFFFTIPLLMVVTLAHYRKISLRSCASTVSAWLPSLLAMFAVCVYKGDGNIARAIWDSWMPCFTAYPMSDGVPQMSSAVEWLTYDTSYAFSIHIHRFWLSKFCYGLSSWPFNMYVIACTFALVTRLNSIDVQFWPLRSIDSSKLGGILLLQLLFLSPMFGFLSCDFGRVIMYWTLSSLFAYHWLNGYAAIPNVAERLSEKIQRAIGATRLSTCWWLYLAILLSLPVGRIEGANIVSCFAFIPYGWKLSFWSHVLPILPVAQ